jgi:hypothetical protein
MQAYKWLPNGGHMRRDEILKADILSEIVLLTSGVAIVLAIVMVVITAVTTAAAQ